MNWGRYMLRENQLKDKRGQEEIVGFIVIVVLVSIVIVILLALMLRQEGEDYKDSREVKGFLSGALEFTSDCAIHNELAYLSLGEVIGECNQGKRCLSGEGACEVLNKTFAILIDKSWPAGEERPVKGYFLNISYEINGTSQGNTLVFIQKGNCSVSRRGVEDISPSGSGNIFTRMILCY